VRHLLMSWHQPYVQIGVTWVPHLVQGNFIVWWIHQHNIVEQLQVLSTLVFVEWITVLTWTAVISVLNHAVKRHMPNMPWRRMGEWRYSSTTLDLSTRWRWLVSFLPQPLSLGKRPHWIGGWVVTRATLEAAKKRKVSCPASSRIMVVQTIA
jgi:hypothetical protein